MYKILKCVDEVFFAGVHIYIYIYIYIYILSLVFPSTGEKVDVTIQSRYLERSTIGYRGYTPCTACPDNQD
jgi:hypothetical protein